MAHAQNNPARSNVREITQPQNGPRQSEVLSRERQGLITETLPHPGRIIPHLYAETNIPFIFPMIFTIHLIYHVAKPFTRGGVAKLRRDVQQPTIYQPEIWPSLRRPISRLRKCHIPKRPTTAVVGVQWGYSASWNRRPRALQRLSSPHTQRSRVYPTPN